MIRDHLINVNQEYQSFANECMQHRAMRPMIDAGSSDDPFLKQDPCG